MHKRALVAFACVAAVGCEQASQELPFEVETDGTVSRVIGPPGGTISTAAGLSLRFEEGSLAEATEIRVAPRDGALGVAVSGDVVSGSAFDVEPSGLELGVPARLSLRVPAGTLEEEDPLTLTGVVVAGPAAWYLSDASVDVQQGILKTGLPRLGTVAVRVSDDVVTIGTSGVIGTGGSSGATAAGPRSEVGPALSPAADRVADFSMACGDTGQEACSTTDALSVTLSPDLYDAVDGCVVLIDPVIAVDLTLEEDDLGARRARGTIAVSGTVRYRTGADGTACSGDGGSVHSVEVDDVYSLGSGADPWSGFDYDAGAETITFPETSVGPVTLDCRCGADIFVSPEIEIGQTSETIEYEGLTGQVSWAVRLTRGS